MAKAHFPPFDSVENDLQNLSIRKRAPSPIIEAESEYVDPYDMPPPSASDRVKTASDGGSTQYYTIPEHASELRHLISHKGMSKARGDIFKACYRLGEKKGVDAQYDLNKMKFFIEDLIEMNTRGEHL
jgi:hypothetical protein